MFGQLRKNVSILSERERHQLLVEWNDTQADYPKNACIHQLFEAQVERSPDTIAVGFKSKQLTYRQLNQRANQLAQQLRSLGVGPEVLVGICVERSLEMVVGLLGILKAGGAYVPLDPTYPKERLVFMLEETQVPVLLTQERLAKELPGQTFKMICLDSNWDFFAQESQENPVSGATPDNLAYVMFTSGSTGKPKGVCCNHVGVVNLLSDFERRQPLHTGDGCSVWTSISFDVSVYEIFSALSVGGTLSIVPETVRFSGMTFVRWLSETKIKSVYLPPFAVRGLYEWLSKEQGKSCLRRLLVGVEPIQEQILAAISSRVPGLQIINGYGPTESTICATLYSVGAQSVQNGNTPIGRPVQNTNIYLLNTDLELISVGESGELYIGGVGLARGYLNQPELTTEKFIPSPFSDEPGVRLYKTGDLARYLPDGNIEYLGRTDRQVKIHGFRIEPGEIEAALVQHPAVREVVVLAREDVPDDKRLVAYFAPIQGLAPTTIELRNFLKDRLPEYMVPPIFVLLDTLPRTFNDKIDRNALPEPVEGLQPELGVEYVEPSNDLEALVVSIWKQVLQMERVGVADNFFDLGGTSLLVKVVQKRLQEKLNRNIPTVALFDHPTIKDFVRYLGDDEFDLSSLRRRVQHRVQHRVRLRLRTQTEREGGQ